MLTRLSLLVITGFLSCSALATDELQGASVADGDEYTLLADNRRKERRGERQDDRDDRQDCRQEEGRLGDDKRECKQEERGEGEEAEDDAEDEGGDQA
jgi:hypothetical protein